jgi:hypothetical protein
MADPLHVAAGDCCCLNESMNNKRNKTCLSTFWRFQLKKIPRIWLMPLLLVMVTAGCEKDRNGITSPEAVTFPTVSSTDPLNDATYVILTQPITATFSQSMNGATLTKETFILMRGTTPIPGIVSCSDTTAIFTPDSILNHYTTYTAKITTGAKDPAGKALAVNYVWSFTTGGPLLGSACSFCHR